MNINVFSCIHFELTSMEQKTLSKQGSAHKNASYKWLLEFFFIFSFSLALFLLVFKQFSFVFPCEYKLALKEIYMLHLLARDNLTLNDPNSRRLMYPLIFM